VSTRGGCRSASKLVRVLVHVAWKIPKSDETPYSEFNSDGVGETGLEPATPGPPDQYSFDGARSSSENIAFVEKWLE
jgi:hypothetical protein